MTPVKMDTSGRRFTPAAAIAAAFLLLRIVHDRHVTWSGSRRFTEWCNATGGEATEYALHCHDHTPLWDAMTRLHGIQTGLALWLLAVAVVMWFAGRRARVLGLAVTAGYLVWTLVVIVHVTGVSARVSRAAVLPIPELIPWWYPVMTIGLELAAVAALVTVTVWTWMTHRRTGEGRTVPVLP